MTGGPPFHCKSEFKKQDFVDMMIMNILCDLPFSQNEPLKSPDDFHEYINILNNRIEET
jgi:hypothetical protein